MLTAPIFEYFFYPDWYVDSKGRKITYKRTDIPFQVVGGKVELGEIPDYIYKIRINGMTEINLNGLINSTTKFKCNYNTGTLYFDSSQEGKFFNITFSAKGRLKYYSKNMIVEDKNNVFANDNAEDVFYEIYQRINNLIVSNPQPSEIQDARANGATGVNYLTLKARLDDESAEIKNAKIDTIRGMTYNTIQERLNKDSRDIGDMNKLYQGNLVDAILSDRSLTVNVKELGAVGDGVADDTRAIQNAFNNFKTGKVIFDGIFKITQPILFSKADITIEFKKGTIIYPYNCNGFEVGDNTGVNRYNNITFDNVFVDMINAPNSTGILCHKIDELKFHNVTVGHGAIGINTDYSYNITLLDTICILQTQNALLLGQGSDKTVAIRGQYGNGEIGVLIQGGKAINFIGTSFERNNAEAVRIESSSVRGLEYPDGLNFVGCYFERNAQVRGQGFVHIGVNNSNINDYAKGINFIGNYFNWDINNPRNPIVPFLYLDKCSKINFNSNRYINSSIIGAMTSNTDKSGICIMNDDLRLNIPSSVLKCDGGNELLIPYNVNITTDSTGYGFYSYDVSSFGFTSKFGTGTINTNNQPATFLTCDVDTNVVKITVHNGTANAVHNVTGILIGIY